MSELLPCPFCGGEASGDGHARYGRPLPDTRWEDGSEITEAFFVNCIKCGVDNGRPGIVGGYQTKAEAIRAWNTRAQTSPVSDNAVERVAETRHWFFQTLAPEQRSGFLKAVGLPADLALSLQFQAVERFARAALSKRTEPMGCDCSASLAGNSPPHDPTCSSQLKARTQDALNGAAIELLARLEEIGGNKAGAFTLRNQGAVGEVFGEKLKAVTAALNPPGHRYWGAGEPDCPREIKAGNGELHTLRCKVCGEDNPHSDRCLLGKIGGDQ